MILTDSSSSISSDYSSSEEDYILKSQNPQLDWIWLDAMQKHLDITDQSARWEDTSLSCCLRSETGAWKNRLEYIEKVVNDILQNFPKNMELSIVSMGAGELLMEFIIGKALIEYGFQNISFFLIEPRHHYDNEDDKQTKKLLKEFRELVSTSYADKWNEPFSEDRIHFLPRSHDLKNCMGANSNVALLECLPPDKEVFNLRFKHELPELDETFMFSAQVPFGQANSVAFVPTALTDHLTPNSQQQGVPFIAIKERKTKVKYGIDWGCKIYPNAFSNNQFVNLDGAENYLKSMSNFKSILQKRAHIKVKNGNSNKGFRGYVMSSKIQGQLDKTVKNVKEKIINQINAALERQIDVFKEKDIFHKLTQEQTTALLEIAVSEFKKFKNLKIPCKPFFLADYAVDRKAIVSFLRSELPFSSRFVNYTLAADEANGYSIDVQETF